MTEKARVLFVDDEQRVLNSMRALFRRSYDLFLTTSGREAVELVRERGIDVIVADQRMPGMDGVEVLSAVKEISPRTVRVLLTGYADPDAIQGSINVGEVFRFLSKPCPPTLLRETLAAAIAASRVSVREAAAEQPRVTAATPARPVAAAGDSSAATTAAKGAADASRRARPPMPAHGTRSEEGAAPAPAREHGASVENDTVAVTGGDDTDVNPILPQPVEPVREVVMSGDTVSEPARPAAPRAGIDLSDVGVAVFTINSEFAEAALLAASRSRKVTLATSLVKVAEILEHRHAGVLVTDFTSDIALLQNMIGMLKRNLPELVTIVISDSRDASDMVNLINYGQIFRYGAKPVGKEQLGKDIAAAVVRHVEFLEHPELLDRHRVLEQQPASGASPMLKQFVSTVRKLGSRPGVPGRSH